MSEYICMKCGNKATDPIADCLQCKGKMLNANNIRRAGRRLAIWDGAMAFLTLIMIVAVMVISDSTLIAMAGPLAMGMVAGLAGVAAGLWQIKHLRSNQILILIMYGSILAMVFGMTFGGSTGW
jgi:hypothetical protein